MSESPNNIELERDRNVTIPLGSDEGPYSFDLYEGSLTVFSECCSSEVTDAQAIKIRDLINKYLEAKTIKDGG